jgi:RNA polymerase sigma-70 factor (ECF subfamily)
MTGMERAQPAPSETSVEDADLVLEALAGGTEAYDELYVRHRDGVARAAYVVLWDAHLAQDVAQEAFLVGWRDLRRLREPRLFRAWVTGVALNLCRRRSVRRRMAERPLETRPELAVPPGGSEVVLMVRDAVAALPARMRDVAVLRFYGEYSEPEIADALVIPLGTVKSRLNRARARLAEALEPLLEEA